MPAITAYIAISVWPLIILFLLKRFGLEKGILLGLLTAYMFLPAGFSINLPGIPAFNKFSVTVITLIAYLLLSGRGIGFTELPKLYKYVLVWFLATPFLTAITNSNAYLHLPGLSYYDGLTDSVGQFLFVVPFMLGFKYFRTDDKHYLIFKYFSMAVLIYAILALYEIRMSPQLHNIVYGYFPHSWLQQVRSGGYRAVVFMGHGLLVALFLAIGLGFLAALKKNKRQFCPLQTGIVIAIVMITLVLMKSMAALVFGLFLYFTILFASTKRVHQLSVMIAIIFLSYPVTSAMEVFPHQRLVNFAQSINPERAQSLEFRFRHESELLAHASHKSLFGWGGWGRNRVWDEETGEDLSVTDGKWILTLGIRGWSGFLAEFFLITLPLWYAFKIQKRKTGIDQKQRIYLASLSLILAIVLLDQMPNASLNPLYVFLAGALLGRAQHLSKTQVTNKPSEQTVKSG